MSPMKSENVPAAEPLPFRIGPALPALGIASLLAAGTNAYGQIVYSGTLNTTVTNTFTNFNVDGLTLNDIRLTSTTFNEGGYIKFGGVGYGAGTILDGSDVARLSFGATIDNTAAWSGGGDYRVWKAENSSAWGVGNEVGAITGYVGFRFTPVSGGQLKYGWAQLTVNATGLSGGVATVTLVDYAYEDSGTAIQAGVTAIPEPSAVALVMGAASLLALRKRRRQAA